MKRAPLARRTPLRARKVEHRTPPWEPVPAVFDIDAAREAMQRQQTSQAAPRRDHAPVTDPQRAKRPAADGSFPPVVRQAIIDRDGYRCQRCGVAIDTGTIGYSLQHRVPRGMGGTSAVYISRPSNGLLLCGSATTGCHGDVEGDTSGDAERGGYAVPKWADPTTVPVLRFDGTWVLLTDNGTAWPCPAPPDGDALAVASRLTTTADPTDDED